jgi:hypothetical protein
MNNDILIGVVMLIIGGALTFFGLPNKAGVSPRFLQFDASLVLYSSKATLQQKMLLWSKKPVEFALSDIDDIAVKSDVDGLSGATIHHSVVHRRSGEIAVLTTEEAKDAAETVKALREFVGL